MTRHAYMLSKAHQTDQVQPRLFSVFLHPGNWPWAHSPRGNSALAVLANMVTGAIIFAGAVYLLVVISSDQTKRT